MKELFNFFHIYLFSLYPPPPPRPPHTQESQHKLPVLISLPAASTAFQQTGRSLRKGASTLLPQCLSGTCPWPAFHCRLADSPEFACRVQCSVLYSSYTTMNSKLEMAGIKSICYKVWPLCKKKIKYHFFKGMN